MSDPSTQPAAADRRLYDRSVATLVDSWAYFATGSPGARVTTQERAAVARFVHRPDRDIFNNAILDRDLAAAEVDDAVVAVEEAYAEVGVERFAVWIHESQTDVAERLKARGYGYDDSTRTMAARLDAVTEVDTSILDLTTPDYKDFLMINGLPAELFPDLGPGGHIYVAQVDGRRAATLMAYDHAGDCGIYNVATLEFARRRGIGTALTAHALREARERGCTTASLQSTAMAERVYAAAGFRDLGRFDEYVPAA